MTNKRLTLHLLERLHHRRIGINEIEVFSRKYNYGGGRNIGTEQKEEKRQCFVRREMSARVTDARQEVRKSIRHFERTQKYFWRDPVKIPRCNRRIGQVMQEVVTHT